MQFMNILLLYTKKTLTRNGHSSHGQNGAHDKQFRHNAGPLRDRVLAWNAQILKVI